MYTLIAILVIALILALIMCIRYRLMIRILVFWMIDNRYAMPDKPYIKHVAEEILKKKGEK